MMRKEGKRILSDKEKDRNDYNFLYFLKEGGIKKIILKF